MPLITSDLEFSDDYPTIEPSLKLDFANARALDPRITFTRASVATYVGKDGLIKTAGENEPRFDHDSITGESLGLLIEEERTNLFEYSGDFTNADWAKFDVSISSNSIIAPDGSTNSYTITEGTANSQHNITDTTTVTGTKTFSVYAKLASGSRLLRIVDYNATDGAVTARFDLSNGTIDAGSDSSAVIKDCGNGWYRCSITTTTTVESNYYISLCQSDSTFTYTGDGSSSFYIFGAQLEVGSFPTSYIPTSGSTVTREKEFPAIETSSIDFNDFSQGGEGTLVCEFSNAGAIGSDVAVCFSGDTHNGATFVGLGTNSNRNAFNRVRVNGTNTVLSTDSNFTTTGFYKVAFGIGQSRCTLAVKGSSSGVLEDTSVSYDSTPYTKLVLGCDQTSNSSNNMINGTIKSVFYYPTLLTDTQLQTLTQ